MAIIVFELKSCDSLFQSLRQSSSSFRILYSLTNKYLSWKIVFFSDSRHPTEDWVDCSTIIIMRVCVKLASFGALNTVEELFKKPQKKMFKWINVTFEDNRKSFVMWWYHRVTHSIFPIRVLLGAEHGVNNGLSMIWMER